LTHPSAYYCLCLLFIIQIIIIIIIEKFIGAVTNYYSHCTDAIHRANTQLFLLLLA